MQNFQEGRLHSIIEGALAANIFDWGSRACVNLYHKGTIIDIYRMSRKKMHRPWQVKLFFNIFIFYLTSLSIFLNSISFVSRLMITICSRKGCLCVEAINLIKGHYFLWTTLVLTLFWECYH